MDSGLSLIRGGRLVFPGPTGRILDGHALICHERILEILPEEVVDERFPEGKPQIIDAAGAYVSPGFLDLHSHGAEGADVMDVSGDAISRISRHMTACGTTAWLPTTLTAPLARVDEVLSLIRSHRAGPREARILGVHLEGPFIDAANKGAHDERYIIPPDADWVSKRADILKIVTYDPAQDSGGAFARTLSQRGIVPSMGHSCANFATANTAALNGARSFTHIFNAMTGLGHRELGMVGAAFTLPLWVELIADGIHIDSHLFEPLCRVKGTDRIILITDAMRATGLTEGNYDLGGLAVTVIDGAARLTSSGVLAGSTLTMNRALANMREATGRPLWEVVAMATINPAALIGDKDRQKGLEIGSPADLTFFDEAFNIRQVMMNGRAILNL